MSSIKPTKEEVELAMKEWCLYAMSLSKMQQTDLVKLNGLELQVRDLTTKLSDNLLQLRDLDRYQAAKRFNNPLFLQNNSVSIYFKE